MQTWAEVYPETTLNEYLWETKFILPPWANDVITLNEYEAEINKFIKKRMERSTYLSKEFKYGKNLYTESTLPL